LKDQAISTYNRVAAEYPDSTLQATEALQRSAKLYQKAKQYEEAIHQYMAVHDSYPGTDGALKSLKECATIYDKKLKQKDKAIEILNTIIKAFPESKDAKRAEKRIKKLNK
jgi:TolA-binding protein